jgi:hypothetical protein
MDQPPALARRLVHAVAVFALSSLLTISNHTVIDEVPRLREHRHSLWRVWTPIIEGYERVSPIVNYFQKHARTYIGWPVSMMYLAHWTPTREAYY